MSKRVCDVEGCEKPHASRGYCSMHLWRVKRHGDPGPPGLLIAKAGERPECAVEGCARKAHAKGWCMMHHWRVQQYGDPGPPGLLRYGLPDAPCRHPDGCDHRRESADGWCNMHARRIRVTGDPGPAEPLIRRQRWQDVGEGCYAPLNDGSGRCGRPVKGMSLCSTHLRRWERNGTLVPKRWHLGT